MNLKKSLELSCTLSINFVEFCFKIKKIIILIFHASFCLFFFQKLYHFVFNCLLCSSFIGLDLESHSYSREKVQFFETRSRIIFLALTWRDEIEIIIWPFSYFETRTRLHIVILVFRDEIETLENLFSWSSEEKMMLTLVENSRDRDFWLNSDSNTMIALSWHWPNEQQNHPNHLTILTNPTPFQLPRVIMW